MAKKEKTIAELLLDAHVQFVIDELSGEGFQTVVEAEVEASLKQSAKLTLNEAVTREMIKETAHVYAVELELHGAIPELVGDIARRLYDHETQDATRLGDLMPDAHFREFLDKVLEMKPLRERLIREAIANPLYSALASDILYHGIKGYVAQNPMTKSIPGASSMLKLGKSVMSASGLGDSIEDNLKKYIHKNIKATLKESENFLLQRIDDEKLEDTVLDVWADLKQNKLSLGRDYVSSNDVEDFFVLAYEYWRSLRNTPWYSAMIDAGIDSFFDKYGDTALPDILAEVGISQAMLVRDAMRFAPPIIKTLKKKKMLEPLVRRQLERFYQSGRVEAVLAGAAGQD